MPRFETFDDFNTSEQSNPVQERKPFQFRDEPNSKEETLKWLNENYEQSLEMSRSRIENFIRWSNLFKGIHWSHKNKGLTRTEEGIQTDTKKPTMVDNYVWEFIDHKVSQMSRLGVNVACIPWNDEISDVINAKACEKLLQARFIEMEMDAIQDRSDFIKFKYGTVFNIPCWNKDIGPINKAYDELTKLYKGKIPKNVLSKLKIKDNFNVGDVDLKVAAPWQVFPELHKKDWKNVNHFDYVPEEWVHIEELKKMYPKVASEIKANKRYQYDIETSMLSQPDEMIQVRHFYHKKTKWLPEGAHIIYCDDVILEWRNLEYNHGDLPLIIDRDIEIEHELFGRPKITNIEQMQRQSNNIESAIGRDLGAGSAPKWIWPKGAVTFKSVTNDFSVMEYKGPKEPKLVAGNPVSQHAVAKLERNEQRMSKKMKVFDVSRGIVPAGIEANSALRFLDEQEDQANEQDKNGRKRRVLNVARHFCSIMGQYYDESDGRTERKLGPNNSYMIEDLKNADFMRVYDVTFQNTSALPDTKTGKIATIIDMNMATQKDPVFKTPQIVKMLDLGEDEAFVDRVTASTNAANMYFDQLMKGQPIPEAAEHNDLLVYYAVFYQRIQDYGFLRRVPEEIKDAVYKYIMTLEMLLWKKAQKNQKVMTELMQLDYFPSFFEIDIPNPAITEPDYIGKGQEMDTSQMKHTNEAISKNIQGE